jgi:hypothetical protein
MNLFLPARKHLSVKRLSLALLFLCTVTIIQAQRTWVGANNGTWGTAANWNPASVPTATDAVTITSGVNVVVNINNAVAASINLGTASNNTSTLTFNPGSQVTVSGAITLGGNNANRIGSIVMTNGGTLKAGSIFLHLAQEQWN